MVNVSITVNLDSLAEDIAFDDWSDRDDIMKFILALDDNMMDIEFTKELIKKLQETLDVEEQ